ncbi:MULTISPECIES: DUF1707 domain-containing protein [unclassified Nocardioides]|uniref:DUF1707 domain-containing protein n=1 Tax=unclassified Nocardioides TaxID=2615069 RepID=UPI00361E64B0
MTSTATSWDYRVSDADRDRVLERLKTAYVEGRLERADFDQRLDRAMAARTSAELAAVTRDLEPGWTARAVGLAPPTGEERVIGALAHATGIVPIAVLPALIMTKTRSPYVRHHAAGALNFQLTLLLVTLVTFGLGAILYAVAWLFAAAAGVVALTGSTFRYPWVLRPFGRGGPYPT